MNVIVFTNSLDNEKTCSSGDYSFTSLQFDSKDNKLIWKIVYNDNIVLLGERYEFEQIVTDVFNVYASILNFTHKDLKDYESGLVNVIITLNSDREHYHIVQTDYGVNRFFKTSLCKDFIDLNDYGHVQKNKDNTYEIHMYDNTFKKNTFKIRLTHLLGHVFGMHHTHNVNSIMYRKTGTYNFSEQDMLQLKDKYNDNSKHLKEERLYISDANNICRFILKHETFNIVSIVVSEDFIYLFTEDFGYWKILLHTMFRDDRSMNKKYDIVKKNNFWKDERLKIVAQFDYDSMYLVTTAGVYMTDNKFNELKEVNNFDTNKIDIMLNTKYGNMLIVDKKNKVEYLYKDCEKSMTFGEQNFLLPFIDENHVMSFRNNDGCIYNYYKNGTLIKINVYSKSSHVVGEGLVELFKIDCTNIEIISLIEDYIRKYLYDL